MKIRHAKPLPHCFATHPAARGLVAEGDLRFTKCSRLFVKVLVFKHPRALCAFWKSALGLAVDRACCGVVSTMASEIHTFPGRVPRFGKLPAGCTGYTSRIECDPRYLCLMGLTVGNLSMEIVTHESVHAGFAYAKRRRGNFWPGALEMDEENVAYPAGIIAKRVNAFLNERGLYK